MELQEWGEVDVYVVVGFMNAALRRLLSKNKGRQQDR